MRIFWQPIKCRATASRLLLLVCARVFLGVFDEQSVHRARSQRAPLERHPVQLQDHPQPGSALQDRPVRDDRPGSRRSPADARLQHCQPELRRAPGVLQHQGPGRPADLAPATPEGRRRADGQPQADRHPGARRPAARQAPLPAQHRHRHGALPQRDPGPGNLRALREGDPGPRRALGQRTGLRRLHHQGPAGTRVLRRPGEREADLLPAGDPRAVPQSGPPDRPDAQRQAVRGHRPAADESAGRPCDDLRQPEHAGRDQRRARQLRPEDLAAHGRAGRLPDRARLRREVGLRRASSRQAKKAPAVSAAGAFCFPAHAQCAGCRCGWSPPTPCSTAWSISSKRSTRPPSSAARRVAASSSANEARVAPMPPGRWMPTT